ncbi:hypothetical protein [uncultured Friedmanniella sp.]|uniref:hypothetical protein n=1 Tax=uncultured Friedmanniella sp. TaxID=335381 RepID=UPI0035CAF665
MPVRILALTATAGLLLAGAVGAPVASAHDRPGRAPDAVVVKGAVAVPASYSVRDLAALPQTGLPDLRGPRHRGHTVTGTLLEPLVTAAAPVLPAVKNAQLRVTITVSGRDHRSVAVALGELASANGNHPALLVPASGRRHDGVDLVFPGDRGRSRTVREVSTIAVAVAAPEVPTAVPAGLRLVAGARVLTLSATDLGRLPVTTRQVAFQSGQGPQQHTETGPTLAAVLRAAHLRADPSTTVAAVAGDGYVATVSPAEATAGRRTLLLATVEDGVPLDQPRLVTDGDVSGGRYVSDVLALQVSAAGRCG